MTANGATWTISVAEAPSLAGKLEFAILSVLIHYNGSYDETLIDWYAALRLGLPELVDPDQVRNVFQRLSAVGIVELKKAGCGPSGADLRFFSKGSFTTALTAQGLVYWNTIRVQRGQTSS
jgi:hypothetical protein